MKITRLEFNPFGENTYIVYDEGTGQAAIVDPGMMDSREQEALDKELERLDLKPVHLVNTHLHVDHAIGNEYVTEKYGLPTEAHPADAFLGKQLAGQASMFHLRIATPTGLEITRELYGGDTIALGPDKLEVIEVPGHSPGSIALYSPTGRFVLTGDALFRGSIGRTDLPGGDGPQLLESIKRNLLSLPDDTTVYPGHGPSTTIGFEKTLNPWLS